MFPEAPDVIHMSDWSSEFPKFCGLRVRCSLTPVYAFQLTLIAFDFIWFMYNSLVF